MLGRRPVRARLRWLRSNAACFRGCISGTAWPTAPGTGRATPTTAVGRSGLNGREWVGFDEKRRESADKPGSVAGNHPSGTHVAVRLERPTRKPLRAAGTGPKARALPYLVLLQVGFAVPPNVATGAVRSYRTVSPLPSAALAATARPDDAGRSRHERLRLGRFALCCTFRGLAPPRRYLAPRPLEPGLSSTS